LKYTEILPKRKNRAFHKKNEKEPQSIENSSKHTIILKKRKQGGFYGN